MHWVNRGHTPMHWASQLDLVRVRFDFCFDCLVAQLTIDRNVGAHLVARLNPPD